MCIEKTQCTKGNDRIVVKKNLIKKWFACYSLFANHYLFTCNQEDKCKIIICHSDTFNCYF